MTCDGCNAVVKILTAFYLLTANLEHFPALVELTVQISGLATHLILPIQHYHSKGIQNKCPLLRFDSRKARSDFDNALISYLMGGLTDGTIERGYYFAHAGAHILPNGRICFVRGSELLGPCDRPHLIDPAVSDMCLLGQRRSPSQLLPLLARSPIQVLLVLAYILLSSIRSLLTDYGIDLQAVLYIVGGQGFGKTTLATRIAGIYEKNGTPAGVVQAGSTHAAVNALMVNLRDQPIVIDDLCLSASKDTARKRIELASKLIRQGTGTIPIIKKVGANTVELPCVAGLIMTAEFHLDNLSDLTRCIIVPVNEPLGIPDELTPSLIGDVIYHYSLWFSEHAHEEIVKFRTDVDDAIASRSVDVRITTNYACLMSAFCSFLRSLEKVNIPYDLAHHVLEMMNQALEDAQAQHQRMIEQIKDTSPAGNLPFCILEGYRNGAFDLAKKIEKLNKHEGIIWKGDLCLRKEPLICFIRQQSGYHDWSSNRITRALKDIGALVLQEENAATIRLSKEPDIPRVYRIRMNILKESAEKY